MCCHRVVCEIRSDTCGSIRIDDFAWFDSVRKDESYIEGGGEVGAHVKGFSQYSENIVAIMFTTMPNLVSSVAVTSIKMLRVFNVILLCSELIIGGMEATLPVES